jgi:hypothetical protein
MQNARLMRAFLFVPANKYLRHTLYRLIPYNR